MGDLVFRDFFGLVLTFFPHCLWSGVATKRKRKRTSAGGKEQKSRRRRRKRKRRKRGRKRRRKRRRRRKKETKKRGEGTKKGEGSSRCILADHNTVYTSHVRMVALTGKSEIYMCMFLHTYVVCVSKFVCVCMYVSM